MISTPILPLFDRKAREITHPAPYKSTPIFDQHSLPDGLRGHHSTKAGVWGVLRVLEGAVALVFVDDIGQETHREMLDPEHPGLIPPQKLHYVEIGGAMQMQVEFYREQPKI